MQKADGGYCCRQVDVVNVDILIARANAKMPCVDPCKTTKSSLGLYYECFTNSQGSTFPVEGRTILEIC